MTKAQTGYHSNSILHSESGKWHDTVISEASPIELQTLTSDWLFDWKKEAALFPIYKLTTAIKPTSIEGLISIEEKRGFFFVSLIENAPSNRGRNKVFKGIPGNLFAFGCKLSEERGFDGFVVFDAKTALKQHYKSTLGAKAIGNSNRMFIDEQQAKALIQFHFPK